MSDEDAPARKVETHLPLHVTEYGGPERAQGGPFEPDAPETPTFVLVHGYAGSSFTWRHWIPALAPRGRVLAVDLKGFGDAPKPDDGRYTPGDLAALVVDLVRELDLRNVTLIGHSLGGGVSLIAALRLLAGEPRRLARLVLVAAAAYPQPLPPLVGLSKLGGPGRILMQLVGAPRVVRSVLRTIVHDPRTITDGQVEAYARPLESADGVRAAMAVGGAIVPQDLGELTRRYPEIDVPALVLWGDEDPVVPLWVGERLAEELPQARLAVLTGCGHLPPEELPEESLARLEDFLDATDGGGGGPVAGSAGGQP